MNGGKILIHGTYASPYYDPVKAHEYYEQHKKLKGRSVKTGSLNDTGKKAAAYVKNRLDEEKKGISEDLKNVTKNRYKTAQNDTLSKVKENSQKLKSNIEALRVKLKKMNPAQRKQAEIQIRAQIKKLKEANDKEREELQNAYKDVAKGISEDYNKNATALNEKYHNKYADEVDKMAKDPNMQKAKKGKSSGSNKGYTFVFRRQEMANKAKSKKK